jgi:hypothetical protein
VSQCISLLNHKQVAIATILTAYIVVLTLSNQAFAQATNQGVIHSVSFVTTVPETLEAAASHLHEIGSQVGKVLEGQQGSHLGFDDGTTRPTIH